MAKTKTPFFSFGAQGSVGESITAQQRGRETLVRSKPLPTDPYSLPQAYQRWCYQDYAYLWRQKDEATKATYRSVGSRYHLTGFQYWMEFHLKNLPDIVGWWRLDDNLGATTVDSSRNSYTATIFGASPADGLIGRALSFDGINDYLSAASPFPFITDFTLECLIIPAVGWGNSIASKLIFKGAHGLNIDNTNGKVTIFVYNTALASVAATDPVPTIPGITYHYIATFDTSDMRARLYRNGNLVATSAVLAGSLWNASAWPLELGGVATAIRQYKGVLDNCIVHSRLLDTAEIIRHSLRRYPA